MIDEQGKPIGKPVKASAIYSKPTLNYLQEKFAGNKKTPAEAKRVKAAIDWILTGQPRSLASFIDDLKKEQIRVVAYRNAEGMVYGMSLQTSHRLATIRLLQETGQKPSDEWLYGALKTRNEIEGMYPLGISLFVSLIILALVPQKQ